MEHPGNEYFARLTLDGERFTGARLPIDALVELQRYRGLVLAAARLVWEREHSGESAPDDFEATFDLAIGFIDNGSATSIMEKPSTAYDAYYVAGRNAIDAAFIAIVDSEFGTDLETNESDVTSVEGVPQDAVFLAPIVDLPELQEFGTSLHAAEVIKLQPESEPSRELTITNETAEKRFATLARMISAPPEVSEVPPTSDKRTSTVAGRLYALDADRLSFGMGTLHFGEVNGRYGDPKLTADLKAVLNSSDQAPLIRVTGRMSWRGKALYRILSVDAVELLEIDTEPWSRRTVELASLPPNWHPEVDESPVIAFQAIDAAREVLRAVRFDDIVPGIFPREDGGVIVEWSSPERVLTVEIGPDLDYYIFDVDVAAQSGTDFSTHNLAEVLDHLGGVVA